MSTATCTYSGRVWGVNGQSKACLSNQVAMVRASGRGMELLRQPLHPDPFHGMKQMGGMQKEEVGSGASLPSCFSTTCNRIREVRASSRPGLPAWKKRPPHFRPALPPARTAGEPLLSLVHVQRGPTLFPKSLVGPLDVMPHPPALTRGSDISYLHYCPLQSVVNTMQKRPLLARRQRTQTWSSRGGGG